MKTYHFMRWLTLSLALTCTLHVVAQARSVPVIDLNQDNGGYAPAPSDDQNGTGAIPVAQPALTAPTVDNAVPNPNLPLPDRVTVLEQQMSNLTQMNLPARIDQLQQQIEELNGKLEEQEHEIQTLTQSGQAAPSAQQAPSTNKAAIDESSASASTAASAAAPTDDIAAAEAQLTQNKPLPDSAAEGQAYQNAFDLMMNKQAVPATQAFENFVNNYPQGKYAVNAHYWLGELYLQQKKIDQATTQFTTVVQKYPTDRKVPDALLRLALIHDMRGEHTQAKQQLQQIVQRYPDSTAAKLAKQRLQSMSTTAAPPASR